MRPSGVGLVISTNTMAAPPSVADWNAAGVGPWGFDGTSNPYKGMKSQLWEGGIRVPCIVRWKSRVTPGAVSERVTGFDVPYPSGDLEDEYIPNIDRILFGIQRVLEYKRG